MAHLQEKRTAPRITTVVPVICRVTAAGPSALPSLRAAGGSSEFSAKTVNMSRDGVLINSDSDLLPQSQLEITVTAPHDGRPIRFTADVAWSRRNAMNLFGRYAAGLRIRKIADRDRATLTEFFRPL